MKTYVVLLAGLISWSWAATAQLLPVTLVHQFTTPALARAPFKLGPDGNFYSVTTIGGSGRGSVFRLSSNGVFTTLALFTATHGQNPSDPLVLGADGQWYGTTPQGGTHSRGTIFRVAFDGRLTTLAHFTDTNGAFPRGLTPLGNGDFIGATVTGANYFGTIYRFSAGGGITTLVNIPASFDSFPGRLTPGPDGHFYGLTYNGNHGRGKIFRVTLDGVLTQLASVTGNDYGDSTYLTLGPDGNFYGTTFGGGAFGRGAAFRVTLDGVLTSLADFNGANGTSPNSGLTLGADGNFYGATIHGGVSGDGTIFKLTPSGALTMLAEFTSRPLTGIGPYGGVAFGTDGSLYGPVTVGGPSDLGAIFRIDLPPSLREPLANRTNLTGTTVTFAVSAFGTTPLSYQWWKDQTPLVDGGNISGASTPALTLANVQIADSGEYSLVISNRAGTLRTGARLTVVAFLDIDNDGVPDGQDQCPGTAPGEVVDHRGCSVSDYVPCAGPAGGGTWRSHGQYIGAVTAVADAFLDAGLMTEEERDSMVAEAVHSDCGKRRTGR